MEIHVICFTKEIRELIEISNHFMNLLINKVPQITQDDCSVEKTHKNAISSLQIAIIYFSWFGNHSNKEECDIYSPTKQWDIHFVPGNPS